MASADRKTLLLDDYQMDRSTPDALRLDGRLCWGMRLDGKRRLRPFAEFASVEGSSRKVRTGIRLEDPMRMIVALDRQESGTDPVDHGVLLQLDTRF